VASEIPLRSVRLPSPQQVVELLSGEFARAGYEVEDVTVDGTSQPPRVIVIADGDEASISRPSRRCRARPPNCWTNSTTRPKKPPTCWKSPAAG
jgi:hypothetical protein